MTELSNQQKSIELLQELGLKEYEAKSFVALTRLPKGTAKEISEISDVPRTRVYDAIRVLQKKGLVEIQHTSPQVFRAVSIEEAAETLRKEFESRTQKLEKTLHGLEPARLTDEHKVTHEVWALSDSKAIANRTEQLIDDAQNEVIFLIGHENAATDEILEALRKSNQQELRVIISTIDSELRENIQSRLPDIEVFVSEFDWLQNSPLPDDDTKIGRILLIDKHTILVSTFQEASTGESHHEQAIFSNGFNNGIVTVIRRLTATGLPID